MGLRFRRRFRIFPGFWLNLSKRLSAGGHGLTVNTGKGGHQETISAIGTGVSYRTRRRKFGNPGGPSNTPRRPVTVAHVLTRHRDHHSLDADACALTNGTGKISHPRES